MEVGHAISYLREGMAGFGWMDGRAAAYLMSIFAVWSANEQGSMLFFG